MSRDDTSGFSGSARAATAMPIALVVGICGSALAITAWVSEWSPTWFGLGLATALGGLGVGFVTNRSRIVNPSA